MTRARNMLVLSLALMTRAALAADVADFYHGKTITVLIGVSPGGEYDLLTRLVVRHIGKQIPGDPTVIAQTMTGAGGLTEANYLYNVAPKDGTFIGSIINALPTLRAVGLPGPQFDPAKFEWIGSLAPTVETMALWHTTGVTTIAQAREKEVVIGANGRGGITDTFPRMFNQFAGAKFKIVTGYPGGNDINLAMQRGEVGGRDNTWSSWKSTKPDWLAQKLIAIIGYEGPKPADLNGVPSLESLAANDEDRQVIRLVAAGTGYGRPLTAPPGVPAERVAALRKAFVAMTKDADFLKDAATINADVDPVSGESMIALSRELMAASPTVMAKAKPLLE